MRSTNRPPCAARQQQTEQRRADVAEMQLAGRAGGKTSHNGAAFIRTMLRYPVAGTHGPTPAIDQERSCRMYPAQERHGRR